MNLHLQSVNLTLNKPHPTGLYLGTVLGKEKLRHGAPSGSSGFSLEQLKKLMSPYFIKGTHSRYGANVVGDGDQSRSGKVLFSDSLSLLLAHHVSKTAMGKTRHLTKRNTD